jgi:hypothetical protein
MDLLNHQELKAELENKFHDNQRGESGLIGQCNDQVLNILINQIRVSHNH